MSLSLHGADIDEVTTDALQRNLMSRLERSESESEIHVDPSLLKGIIGQSPNCCAASHDGVINPNSSKSPTGLVPTSIEIGPDSEASTSLDASGEISPGECAKAVSIGSKIMNMTGMDTSKHSGDGKKGKGFGSFLNRLAGKGKGSEKKTKSPSGATYDANDSDIESDGDCSISSFASDNSL